MPECNLDPSNGRTRGKPAWWNSGIVLLAFLVAAPASAQNLLVNAEFDESIDGWTCEGDGTVCSWSEDDPFDDPVSGSGQVTRDGVGSIRGEIAQCVELPAPGLYEVSGELRTIAENGRNGQLDIAWFPEASCAGIRLRLDFIGVVPAAFGWTPLQATLAAPEAAVSLEYVVSAFATETETHTVRIDAAFVPEPGAMGASLAAGAALLGLRRARRR